MAVNTIIQGTAAEIMKLGMINVDKYLTENKVPRAAIVYSFEGFPIG
jgi:DNA polymerase I-like protein with 3'-5' exonuclease and polymerase domains